MSEQTSQRRRWRGQRTTRHFGRRLLILYALMAAVVITAFSAALLASWSDNEALVLTTNRRLHAQSALTRLRLASSESSTYFLDYLITADTGALTAYQKALAERQAALDDLATLLADDHRQADLSGVHEAFTTVDRLALRASEEQQRNARSAALTTWQRDGALARTNADEQLTALQTSQEQRFQQTLTGIERSRLLTLVLTLGFTTISALIGVLIVQRVILGITQPLETLAKAATAIGAGHLETRVSAGMAEEFDTLGGVMNTMAAHLTTSRDELRSALAATERRNEELRLLSEVGGVLNGTLELATLTGQSLDVILPAVSATHGAIVLFDENGELWHWHQLPAMEPIADDLRERIGQVLDDALSDPADEGGHTLLRDCQDGGHVVRVALVPLEAAVRAHGLLITLAGDDWHPDERHIALLEQVASQIARAIENVQLFQAEKGRSAEAGMLAQMAQLTTGTLDLDRLARLIARFAVQQLGVDRCIIGFFDPHSDAIETTTLRRLYQYGFNPQQAGLTDEEQESLQRIARRQMLEGQILFVEDAERDQRPEVRDLAQSLGGRSFVSVPLLARERPLGVIYLDTRAPRRRHFSPSDQRILTAIADQVAAAIDAARLYEAERRRATQLRVLYETSKRITAPTDLSALFGEVAMTIREAFNYRAVRVGLIDNETLQCFTSEAPETTAAPASTTTTLIPLDADPEIASAIRTGTMQTMTSRDDRQRWMARAILPLRIKDEVIGILEIAGRQESVLAEEARRTLAALADQLGLAVEKQRLQARALALAVVEERNRLARELHDSVTQSLFSMSLTIEATRLLVRRDLVATEQQLIALGLRMKETIGEMRRLIHSLRPSEMEDRGLIAALQRWGDRIRHEHLLPVDVITDPGTRIVFDEEVERELFRIAQEALTNVLKHAAATRATIRLEADSAATRLTIEDDGYGFDQASASRADAFGIVGMVERATRLGGTLTIDSAVNAGTRVMVIIPVACDHQAPGDAAVAPPSSMTDERGEYSWK